MKEKEFLEFLSTQKEACLNQAKKIILEEVKLSVVDDIMKKFDEMWEV